MFLRGAGLRLWSFYLCLLPTWDVCYHTLLISLDEISLTFCSGCPWITVLWSSWDYRCEPHSWPLTALIVPLTVGFLVGPTCSSTIFFLLFRHLFTFTCFFSSQTLSNKRVRSSVSFCSHVGWSVSSVLELLALGADIGFGVVCEVPGALLKCPWEAQRAAWCHGSWEIPEPAAQGEDIALENGAAGRLLTHSTVLYRFGYLLALRVFCYGPHNHSCFVVLSRDLIF
jgi:hypothetical protein